MTGQPTRSEPPRSPATAPSRRRATFARRAFATFLSLFALAILGRLLLPLLPLPQGLADPAITQPPLEILDRHGASLRLAPATNGLITRPLSEADIPRSVILATLAAEDARFFHHPGVDPLATVRALGQWVRHRRVISGASTVSQQLIKLAQPRPRTLRTKLTEAVLALRLETEWDKDRILHAYLGRIDYGNRCAGLTAAAQHYFAKAPAELSLAEAAFLAGLPQAPSRLNPRLRFPRAKARQEWILKRCRQLDWIEEDTLTTALAEPIQLAHAPVHSIAPHFIEFVLASHRAVATREPLRTTLDPALQRECEDIVRTQLAAIREKNAQEASVVVLHNPTGELLAMVGSPDWSHPTHGQVNGALARRSPGSALKPFTYLLAFVDGAQAGDITPDIPTSFPTPTGLFQPANYDRHFRGPVSLRRALANSLNIPAVRILDDHGGAPRLLQLLHDLGLSTLDRPPEHYGLGLTLGDGEVRLLDLANAYATLARRGVHRPVEVRHPAPPIPTRQANPRRIDSSRLKAGCPHPADRSLPSARQALPPDECWLVADILADATARADAFGLSSPLHTPFPVACKTGTSSAFRDNWAFGFTPEFTVGVWVGNFDGSPMSDISGVTGAAPILRQVFEFLHERDGTTDFTPPDDLVRAEVDPLTGRAAHPSGARETEVFLHGARPSPAQSHDHASDGTVRLPSLYRDWFHSADNRLGHRVQLANTSADGSAGASTLRILTPQPGSVYFLDPDLPADAQRIRLNASEVAVWSCPTLKLETRATGFQALLSVGRHHLRAVDATSTLSAETWIEVRRR
jgi:penicillin-binding protein 1C